MLCAILQVKTLLKEVKKLYCSLREEKNKTATPYQDLFFAER